MKRRKKWVVFGVVVSLLMYPVAWLGAQYSDAYVKAVEFLRTNERVTAQLGAIDDVALSFFGYSLRYTGAYGEANFEVQIEGRNATASAYVELKKRGTWEVSMARLTIPEQPAVTLK